MEFPVTRMRRLRKNQNIRTILTETKLNPEDFIYPLFIKEGLEDGQKGTYRHHAWPVQIFLNDAVDEASKLEEMGLSTVLLFGMPLVKDEKGSMAYNKDGIVQQAVRRLKAETDLVVITDVCMCQYTSHGHCGIIDDEEIIKR